MDPLTWETFDVNAYSSVRDAAGGERFCPSPGDGGLRRAVERQVHRELRLHLLRRDAHAHVGHSRHAAARKAVDAPLAGRRLVEIEPQPVAAGFRRKGVGADAPRQRAAPANRDKRVFRLEHVEQAPPVKLLPHLHVDPHPPLHVKAAGQSLKEHVVPRKRRILESRQFADEILHALRERGAAVEHHAPRLLRHDHQAFIALRLRPYLFGSDRIWILSVGANSCTAADNGNAASAARHPRVNLFMASFLPQINGTGSRCPWA